MTVTNIAVCQHDITRQATLFHQQQVAFKPVKVAKVKGRACKHGVVRVQVKDSAEHYTQIGNLCIGLSWYHILCTDRDLVFPALLKFVAIQAYNTSAIGSSWQPSVGDVQGRVGR